MDPAGPGTRAGVLVLWWRGAGEPPCLQSASRSTALRSSRQDIHTRSFSSPGVTPRVIRHIFQVVEALRKKEKPGEKTQVRQHLRTACSRGPGRNSYIH